MDKIKIKNVHSAFFMTFGGHEMAAARTIARVSLPYTDYLIVTTTHSFQSGSQQTVDFKISQSVINTGL